MMAGIHPAAGKVRSGKLMARAGTTYFVPAVDLPTALATFVDSLETLLQRADISSTGKAAWALITFLSIHPFSDGNGRLSRILVNYVLSRSGVPFAISFPAVARKQFCSLVRSWRQQLFPDPTDSGSGRSSSAQAVAAAKCSRQVSLEIANCLTLAWSEFERSREAKTLSADQEASELAARLRREAQQKEGACIICLEGEPNTSSLCCGATYHLICFNDWLASAAEPSCCQCRHPISYRANQPPPAAADNFTTTEEEEDTSTSVEEEEDTSTSVEFQAAGHQAPALPDDSTTTVEEEEEEESQDFTTTVAEEVPHPAFQTGDRCTICLTNQGSSMCDFLACARCCPGCRRH
jgi:hypothetical protein